MESQVFIAYCTEDAKTASAISRALNEADPDLRAFVADQDLPPGFEISPEIRYAIEQCTVFVVLLNSRVARSLWVQQEIGLALGLRKHIVPVLLRKKVPVPGFIRDISALRLYDGAEGAMTQLVEIVSSRVKPRRDAPPVGTATGRSREVSARQLATDEGSERSSARRDGMARSVFFSFHYQRDIWRVNVVRNCGVVIGHAAAGFRDGSLWEEAKRKGDAAIKRLIDNGLVGTSVTVVLIGRDTYSRQYVDYEIERSIARGNGLFGLNIAHVRDQFGHSDVQGPAPLRLLSGGYPVHTWTNDGEQLGRWVEDAYQRAQRKAAGYAW